MIGCRGAEEGRGCPGSAGEEAPVASEEEEDLRGANSAAGEGVEAGGVDMCAPSPGKLTWAMTAHDGQWTNQDVCLLSPWKCGRIFVITVSLFFLFCNKLY